MDLEFYKPLSDFSKIEDYILDIWYNSNITKLIRLIDGCEIKYDKIYPSHIFYFKNSKYVMEYQIVNHELWFDNKTLDINNWFGKDYIFYLDFLNNHFKFKVAKYQIIDYDSRITKKTLNRFNPITNKIHTSLNSCENYIKLIEFHFNEI